MQSILCYIMQIFAQFIFCAHLCECSNNNLLAQQFYKGNYTNHAWPWEMHKW